MKPFDDLVHRVNNLLGTIEIQLEEACAEGSLETYERAAGFIAESARKTREEMRVLIAIVSAAEAEG